ncbi:MAG: hypothetical protein F4X97_13310 [Boseongicola sp. SB0662_bin_57]|nr:terminase large subunit [Rhodospirillaceae bacterium]MYA89403.1 hypothetical protein [Boseongicola sp. SB0662_bin_57]
MTPTERCQRSRAKAKAERETAFERAELERALTGGEPPADAAAAVQAVQEWARENLVIPPGHPNAGEPMELPDFAADFLRDAWNAPESALSVARKNAKSAICAVLALAFIAGPLAPRGGGMRIALASLSRDKAGELRDQVEAIAVASGLDGLKFMRRKIIGPGGRIEVLAADAAAGHASGFDLVIVDETGLMPERRRAFLAGLRSSVSAKQGRIVHISVKGGEPLFREVLENPATVAHVHAAPPDCTIDDPAAWRAANPGLGTIKQEQYMRDQVERIRHAPADEPAFRAFDLNQAVDPEAELIITASDLRTCFVQEADLPPRRGSAFVGFDFGEARSGTAAAAVWPQSGRCEFWLAFGDQPSPKDRGKRDDAPYEQMIRRGELRTYPGQIVPVADFLADVAQDLGETTVAACGSDPYKRAEAKTWLQQAAVDWPYQNAEGTRKHSADVRALTRLVHGKRLAMRDNLALVTAIAKHKARRDVAGNVLLTKQNNLGRIDLLSAWLIACGLGEESFDTPLFDGFVGVM